MLNAQRLGKLRLVSIVVCVTQLGGCADAEPAAFETEQTTDHVMETLSNALGYQDGGFVLLTDTPVPSSAVAGAEFRLWVSREAVDEYKTVKQKANIRVLPVGAAVVREVFKNGALEKVTMLAKGPPGTNPELGDLWFAVFDAEGNIMPDKSGNPQLGNLVDCIACHKTRDEHAYLFGL